MKNKILVIGEACKDIFCYGDSDRLCPEAPAPVFNPIETINGHGMAMNVQKNILSLGVDCDLITNQNWEKVVKIRYIHKNTNQMFIRIDYNNDKIEKFKETDDLKIDNYDAVVISDYNKGFLSEDDIRKISLMHNCVFLDTKRKLGPWCNDIDFIKINHYEYKKTKEHITRNIENKLIVTLGSKGSRYKGKTFPVDKVEIKDVTGAGDTFLAGLAVKYIKTEDVEEAIIFANECSSKVVQKRGTSTP